MLDKSVRKEQDKKNKAGSEQYVATAGSRVGKEKVFCEIRVLQACPFYYGADKSVTCAKFSYETIRRVLSAAPLTESKPWEHVPVGALTSEQGGMWRSRHERGDQPPGVLGVIS